MDVLIVRFAVGLAAAAVLASSADAFVAQVLPVLPGVSAAIPSACVAFRGSGPQMPLSPPSQEDTRICPRARPARRCPGAILRRLT
jgi:hypothetical protein